MMSNILIGQIGEDIYIYIYIYKTLVCCEPFPEEQKRYREGTRTNDILYIEQHMLIEKKKKNTSEKCRLGMDCL